MQKRKPIVCSLSAAERAERGHRWQQLVAQWSGRFGIEEKGATIRFDDAGVRGELEELVAQERRCCEWMELDLREEGSGLILTIGSENGDGAAAIRNMMAFSAEPVRSDPEP